MVAEEELMNVAGSPLRTGEETGQKPMERSGVGGRMVPGATVPTGQAVAVEESLA